MSDTYSLAFLAVILFAVGNVMCGRKTVVQKWSARLAGAAWLGYSLYFGGPEAEDWVYSCLGGLLAAALVYGVSLIAFSVLTILFGGMTIRTYHVEREQVIEEQETYEPLPEPRTPSREERVETAKRDYEEKLAILKNTLTADHFETAQKQLYKSFLQQIEAIID